MELAYYRFIKDSRYNWRKFLLLSYNGGYTVFTQEDGGEYKEYKTTDDKEVDSMVVEELKEGTDYCFKLQSVTNYDNRDVKSYFSDEVCVTTEGGGNSISCPDDEMFDSLSGMCKVMEDMMDEYGNVVPLPEVDMPTQPEINMPTQPTVDMPEQPAVEISCEDNEILNTQTGICEMIEEKIEEVKTEIEESSESTQEEPTKEEPEVEQTQPSRG
jgi:hypothetical protein